MPGTFVAQSHTAIMQSAIPKKFLYPLFTFVVSMLITSTVLFLAYKSQLKYVQSLVSNLAEQQTENLAQALQSDLHFIGAGANFFHATDSEDWHQFSVFADELIASSDSLVSLQWMQRVSQQQLESHVSQVRQRFPEFSPYTVPKHGPKTLGYIMPNNEDIYIASDIYPRDEANLKLLGFYSSRTRFQLVLDGIRASGLPNVSDKVRLIQDGLDRSVKKEGLLVYHPVFKGDKQERLIGVVIGVIRTTRYFDGLIGRTASGEELLVKVTDMGFEAEDDPILYQSPHWEERQGFEISKKVVLPNREWIVDFKLANRVTNNDILVLQGVGLGGLVIACLLSYIVFLSVRDKEYLSILLDERTKELQFMVNHDSLTGVLNRRAFNDRLLDLVRNETVFTLVGFDIDKFKRINDSFGHVAGDEMLIHVANVVEQQLMPDDELVRMGGDEFCIVSTITEPNELFHYLNGIGRAVATSVHLYGDKRIQCTLSIGAAIRTSETEEEIQNKADSQLYKSKQAGRNCVSIAE